MRLYEVEALSIYFSGEPAKEYSIKYFTILYVIKEKKIIRLHFFHTAKNMDLLTRLPCSILLDERVVNIMPVKTPTTYSGQYKIFVLKK